MDIFTSLSVACHRVTNLAMALDETIILIPFLFDPNGERNQDLAWEGKTAKKGLPPLFCPLLGDKSVRFFNGIACGILSRESVNLRKSLACHCR